MPLPSLMENEREKSGSAKDEANRLNWATNLLVIHLISGVPKYLDQTEDNPYILNTLQPMVGKRTE